MFIGKWTFTEETVGRRGEYMVWKRRVGSTTIYNVTKTGRPPRAGDGGYPNKASLFKLKGIKEK